MIIVMEADFDEALSGAMMLSGHTNEDWTVLKEVASTTAPWGPPLAELVYDALYAYEPTAEILEPFDRKQRERTLIAWYESVVTGQPGPEFWIDQWIVGLIHVQRDVPNAFMLGAFSRITQYFLDRCLAEFADKDKAISIYRAFARVTDTVGALMAEGYSSGLITGMKQVGVNPELTVRMRGEGARRVVAKLRKKPAEG